jgi:hypothetical protein
MKILFCLAVVMTFLVAPFALDFTETGKVYAMGGGGGGGDDSFLQADSRPGVVKEIGDDPGQPHPAPEPGTILLMGVGLVGLAIYGRKKFKK